MPAWRLRDYHDEDLDQAIGVWDQSRGPGSAEPVFSVAEVMAAARSGEPAVIAEVGDEVVGMAVAQTQGERAWILLLAIGSRWRGRGSAQRCWPTLSGGCVPRAYDGSAPHCRMGRPVRQLWRIRDTPAATGSSTTN